MKSRIGKSLAELDGKQGKIVAMVFGVNGEEKKSLDVISKELGVKKADVKKGLNSGLDALMHKIDI